MPKEKETKAKDPAAVARGKKSAAARAAMVEAREVLKGDDVFDLVARAVFHLKDVMTQKTPKVVTAGVGADKRQVRMEKLEVRKDRIALEVAKHYLGASVVVQLLAAAGRGDEAAGEAAAGEAEKMGGVGGAILKRAREIAQAEGEH